MQFGRGDSLARRSIYDLPTLIIGGLSQASLFRWKVPEPLIIAGAAVAGLALHHTQALGQC